jgi:hypothetical protein
MSNISHVLSVRHFSGPMIHIMSMNMMFIVIIISQHVLPPNAQAAIRLF